MKKREQRSRCLEFIEGYHIVFPEVKDGKIFRVLAGCVPDYLLRRFFLGMQKWSSGDQLVLRRPCFRRD
jgi:hypothetical protein